MRIGFVSHSSERYGASRSLVDLIVGLRLHGCDARVFLPAEGPCSALLDELGVPVEIVPVPRWLVSDGQSGTIRSLDPSAGVLAPLRERAAGMRLDALHSNSLVTPAGALVARALGLPHVWHVREFGDHDYALRWTLPRAQALAFVRAAGPVVCVSDAVRRHHFGDQPDLMVHRVHNGVFPRARMADAARTGSGPAGRVLRFGVVGRLMPQKAQHVALEALAIARRVEPDLQLVVVGEGRCEYAPRLRAQVEALDLAGAVHFAGELEDREAIYAACDAVIVCSVMEAFGRVAAEAMALGLPVIARATGGSPELIEHELNGLLFDGSAADLARRMLALCADPASTAALAAAGLRQARARFTVERCSAAIAALHRAKGTPGVEWNATGPAPVDIR